MVVENASLQHTLDVVTRVGDDSAAFPAVRLAVIVAVISVASPYLTRPVRRLGQLLVLLIAIASLYLGTTLPDGALAAVALGWAIAALVHLVFGSPGGRPTTAQVAGDARSSSASTPTTCTCCRQQPSTGTAMAATRRRPASSRCGCSDATKPTRSSCRSSGARWRTRTAVPTLHTTRLEDVEAQAYALLLAERAGVHVPPVVVAGTAGPGRRADRVSRPLAGHAACATPMPADVTDAMLDDLWKQVASLHAARVAHGRLNCQPRRRRRHHGRHRRLRARDRRRGRRDGAPPTSPSCS